MRNQEDNQENNEEGDTEEKIGKRAKSKGFIFFLTRMAISVNCFFCVFNCVAEFNEKIVSYVC